VSQERLVTKVYFPRLLVPLAPIAAGLLDFGLAFGVLVGMQIYYGIVPGLAIVSLPFFILLTVATAFGVGLWLSALNVQYRDVRFTVPFLIQLWLFATPIAYSSSLIPDRWKAVYGLNPMVGVVDGFRWAMLGQGDGPSASTAVSTLAVVALVVTGLYYFRRTEQHFADVV
jgi:lipopolysaccharide transport system permease protein